MLGLAVLLSVLAAFDSLVHWDHNLLRLDRSFALAGGQDLYPEPGTGIAVFSIYPPLSAVAYLPATWASSPTAAIAIGLGLSFAFVIGPLVGLLLAAAGPETTSQRRSSLRIEGLLLALFLLVALTSRPLSYLTFSIHADAPAVGLSLLACLALLGPRPTSAKRLAISALFAVLALWTKQVTVFLFAALPLWLALSEQPGTSATRRLRPRAEAWRWLGWAAAIGIAVSVVICLGFGSPAILFEHLVILPSRHPWQFGGGVRALLFGSLLGAAALAAPFAIAAASLLPSGLQSRRGATRSPWLLLWLAAMLSLPTAVLTRIKDGGDVNAFAMTAYLAVAGALLALRAPLVSQSPNATSNTPWPRRRTARMVARVVLVATAAPALLVAAPRLQAVRDRAIADLPWEVAFRNAKKHPGELYLPRMTAVSALAEGAYYHTGPALLDLERAGLELDPEWVRAGLPKLLRRIAYLENGYQQQAARLSLPGVRPAPADPELPGFALFAVESGR